MLLYKKLLLDVTFLDNRYYDNVIKEMQPFFNENGFKLDNDVFSSEKMDVKVVYNDEKQVYSLLVAKNDEEDKEFIEINSWLFDDSQNARDAESVGIDFTQSLRKELGLKKQRTSNVGANIELPSASKNGNINVSSFTKKMLDVYPPLKEAYKEHIAVYGNFLYINFFGEHLVPALTKTFTDSNKKQVKKLYDVFEDVYLKGDRESINILVAVLCAAAYKNEKATESVRDMLSDDSHFLAAFDNFASELPKNKKLFKALVK